MAAAGGCFATVTMAVVALTFQSSTAAADSPAAVRPAGTAAPDANARTELKASTRQIRADLMSVSPFRLVDDRIRRTVHDRGGAVGQARQGHACPMRTGWATDATQRYRGAAGSAACRATY